MLKRHWMMLALCLVLVAITAIGNVWYLQYKNKEITVASQESARKITDMDTQLSKIKQQKIEAARKAEEALDAADAKKAAEDSIINGSAGSTMIDSKLCNKSKSHNNPASIDVVVNKKHCIQPLGYVPNVVTSNSATLSVQVIDDFNQLFAAAAAAGQPFYVTSSYRSYATQVSTYRKWVATSGQVAADTYSARPGYSEHQTGFAFDVAANGCALDCFGSTTQYKWFQENAASYGFIQRYYKGMEDVTGYKAEEWHYRYVGREVAKGMRAKGIKTLEQYWNVPGGDY